MLHPDRGHAQAEVHLDAAGPQAGQFAGNAQLTAQGRTDALGFKLDVQLPDLRGAKASLSAGGSLNIDARMISVASAVANYHGQDLRLLAPAQIALAHGVSVDQLKIGAQEAVLQLEGEISPALDVRASLRQVKPALINVFAPGLLASGSIEAHAQMKGSVASPTGQVRLIATDLALADDAAFGLPSLDLKATAQLTGDTADIDAQLVAGTASKLSVTGKAPLAANGALNLKMSGSLDVGMVNTLLEARGQHAAGRLDVDATVAGNVCGAGDRRHREPDQGQPARLRTRCGPYRYHRRHRRPPGNLADQEHDGGGRTRNSLDDRHGRRASIGRAGGSAYQGRQCPAAGKQVGDGESQRRFARERHRACAPRHRRDGPFEPHADRHSEQLAPNVAVLDVRRHGKPAPPARERQLVIGMDVAVQAPQEFLVQGRGLDAEMGGDLHLGGTLDAPSVSGGLGLLRGNFHFRATS